MPNHRVVVIGGGFAGLNAVRSLDAPGIDVTLIDRRNFYLFQPLLYQVATGSLSPGEISSALRSLLRRQRNVRVLLGDAAVIDANGRTVTFADGHRVDYDTLIVCAGSVPSYFGHDEWREHALCLKSIEDATELRRRIFLAFERAEAEASRGASPWLSFAIVGAGPTGVELAGALSEIARKTLREDFRSIQPEYAQLTLVDNSPRVLPTFPEFLSKKAEATLLKLGVRVRCGVRVTAIDADGLTIEVSGTTARVAAKTVIWAGGVAAPPILGELARATGAPTDGRGRFLVNPDLTLPAHPEIFVCGDAAALQDPSGHWLPGVAQVAMQQGQYASTAVIRRVNQQDPPAPFRYRDRGDMAVIGRAAAVGVVFGRQIWGWPAWILWLFLHLMYLVDFESRLVVLVRWAFNYVLFRRGARLIIGGR